MLEVQLWVLCVRMIFPGTSVVHSQQDDADTVQGTCTLQRNWPLFLVFYVPGHLTVNLLLTAASKVLFLLPVGADQGLE